VTKLTLVLTLNNPQRLILNIN